MALFCKTKASLLVFFCLLWSGAPPHHEESSDDHPTFCGTPSDDPGQLRNIQKTRFGGGWAENCISAQNIGTFDFRSEGICRPGAEVHQPLAGDAARGRDACAAGRAPPSGTPAASGCAAFAGGVVLPAPGASVPRFHTGAQGRRRPATCMCALRPLRACARARSALGHGRRRGTHTPRRRSSRSCPRAADAVCVRSHTLTVARLIVRITAIKFQNLEGG